MDIRIAADSDREQWNQFVDREGGSFFQYYDWKFVYEFKKQNRFIPLLIQDSNSDITGIFPLVEQKAERIYPWLSSMPEGATGGFLLSNSLSEDEKIANLNLFFTFIDKKYSPTHSFITLREQIRIEKRSIEPTPVLFDNGYQWLGNPSTGLPCTHYLKLEQPFEEKIWNGLLSKSMRRKIRHVRKAGFHVIIDDKLEYLDDFVEMQCQTDKKFGGVTDRERVIRIFTVFQGKIKLFIGLLGSQPISAVLGFYTPTIFYLSKGPYLPIASGYLTNTLPNCAPIRYACEQGFRYVEFGITTTPGIAYHKEKFKATPTPLRTYTKRFSLFKFYMNKTYGFIMD